MSSPGTLYLVPTPLDFGCTPQAPLDLALPGETIRTAARLQHWVCENAKSARAFLKRVDAVTPLAAPLQSLHVTELPHGVHKKGDHAGAPAGFDAAALLQAALAGHDIGLVSEAGMPAVADPGSSVVRAAQTAGIPVVALAGPVSLMLALAASGLNGQNFAFVGYLPQDAGERTQRIRELEALALRGGQTQLVIETPYRNAVLLKALLQTLQPNTWLAVASGLTLPNGRTHAATVRQWRQWMQQAVDGTARQAPANDTPAVFCLGR
ncbi:MAG: SAM-dependent methyltransferase [Burkholderiaceae bacterium]|nr:SAM-dependent methyltransferase [Burkholderiaceae bacterium]